MGIISKNIDEWMKRHENDVPKRSGKGIETVKGDAQVRSVQFNKFQPRGTSWGNFGTPEKRFQPSRLSSQGRGNFNRSFNPRSFCPGCNYLAKELNLEVNFKHLPADCPRKRSVLRMLRLEDENLAGQETDPDQEPYQNETDPHWMKGLVFFFINIALNRKFL